MEKTKLARANNGEVIQAFPIHKYTKVGTLTDEPCSYYSAVHANEDIDITFKFYDTNITDFLLSGVLAGMDFGISDDVKSVTTTGSAIIS